MALTFPLATNLFFDKLKVVSAKPFTIPDNLAISQTAGGELITADLGTRLWETTITVRPRRHQDAKEIRALIHMLMQGWATFLAYDPSVPYPAADSTGSILGAATPQINSLPTARELTLKSLPAGYIITAGDLLSFTYSSSPTRYALHQVVTGATANGSGVTGNIEVTPAIRTGAAVNAFVTLVKPVCKMLIVPGSADLGSADILFTTGVQFSAKQTLR